MKEIQEEKVLIKNIEENSEIIIEPYAVESCMRPGTFLITPIVMSEDTDKMTFSVKDSYYEVLKKDIQDKKIVLEYQPFVPQKKVYNTSCIKCTNCGRCSW